MASIAEFRSQRKRSRAESRAIVKALLVCGLLYAVLYAVVNDWIAASLYEGYSRSSQAISELSATAAPSRTLLTAMLPVFTALLIAFGVGVWMAAERNCALRVTGGVLIGHGITFPLWLLAPMTSREEMGATMSANDVGHIALSVLAVSMILVEMASGAAALGRGFRIFSVLAASTLIVFGALTGIEAPQVGEGGATPLMGLYERISYASWLVWLSVLAITLLRRQRERPD